MGQEQPSSVFSALDASQLQAMHQNLDSCFGAQKNENKLSESAGQHLEETPKVVTGSQMEEDLQQEQGKKNTPCCFDFPDGGWECSKCQNYNFKGRKECHRCKKPKTVKDTTGRPEHMFKPEQEKVALKAAKNKQKRMNKAKKLKEAKALLEQQAALAAENPEMKEIGLDELTQ